MLRLFALLSLFMSYSSFASAELLCECRYTRINNNWGEVELYAPSSGADVQFYHQYFPPNVSDEQMATTCQEANKFWKDAGVCGQITTRRCTFGLQRCD